MTAWYNENDPYAAQWLRNLIAAGHIAPGVVDERDIREIEAFELTEFTQCHFFAGIGIWSAALRRAGWPDDRPIWTGSCPCQPFSQAGKQKGFSDDRHLWPYWHDLIRQCRPPIVVGEQVASALDWLDLVSADLESAHYAFGAADLCAAGFGGAHIRQRAYFVGMGDTLPAGRAKRRAEPRRGSVAGSGPVIGLADATLSRQSGACRSGGSQDQRASELRGIGRLANADISAGRKDAGSAFGDEEANGRSRRFEFQPDSNHGHCGDGADRHAHASMLGRNAVDWLYCRDDKWRPVEPGTFPLVDADTARVGKLRAYGNGLDLETAAQFCGAVKEIAGGL